MPAEEKRATVDTCFGLFGPHQHGVAKSKSQAQLGKQINDTIGTTDRKPVAQLWHQLADLGLEATTSVATEANYSRLRGIPKPMEF